MFIDISRLSVRVGVELGISADDMLGIVDEIAVGADTCTCIFFSDYKGFFQVAQSFLPGIFCNTMTSLPTSVLAESVNVLLGRRSAQSKSA